MLENHGHIKIRTVRIRYDAARSHAGVLFVLAEATCGNGSEAKEFSSGQRVLKLMLWCCKCFVLPSIEVARIPGQRFRFIPEESGWCHHWIVNVMLKHHGDSLG